MLSTDTHGNTTHTYRAVCPTCVVMRRMMYGECGRCASGFVHTRTAIVATAAEVAFEDRLESLRAARRSCAPGSAEWLAADEAVSAHMRAV